jgi:glycosyltransferase involved in cell wall biosynthesis
MKKLSIVTINLNNLIGLKKTMDSIYPLGADFEDLIEHIVIDGYSDDGSQEYLIANKELGYSLTIEKDSGIFNAMNKGLIQCEGEYVIFMNSGDLFYKGVLEKEFSRQLENYDIIYGNIIVEKNGQVKKEIQTNSLDFFYLLGKTICHQSVFMKTQLCKKYPFKESKEFSIMGDWIQLFELLKNENLKIKQVNEIICTYNIEGESEKNKDLRLKQRNDYLKSIYSNWELEELMKISRLRNRKYYNLLIKSLDKFSYARLLNFLGCIASH